jgi:DNA-directed RNA polymerase subunit M/transcription elongation factor TFIIS
MKFCSQCDNMYYIKTTSKDSNDLIYYCRNCKYEDPMISTEGACIIDSHSQCNNIQFNQAINQYTKDDPTLPRVHNIKCPNAECESNKSNDDSFPEVIYLRYDDANMKYVYICNSCDNIWKTNDEN